MKKILLAFFLLVCSLGYSQQITRIKNLKLWVPAEAESTNPDDMHKMAVVGNSLFFVDYDSLSGRELFKHNGNPGDTSMVKDITVNDLLGQFIGGSGPKDFLPFNGKLYFTASQTFSGSVDGTRKLWSSDGTEIGTDYVAPSVGGPEDPYNFIAGQTLFYFKTGLDNQLTSSLWRSDGTEAGTYSIVLPDTLREPKPKCTLGDALLFTTCTYVNNASGGVNKYMQIWKNDGTQTGNTLLHACPLNIMNNNWVNFDEFTALGNKVYFKGSSLPEQIELWQSDGTPSGTGLFVDLNGTGQSNPSYLFKAGNYIYFTNLESTNSGLPELWRTDGTVAGTILLTTAQPTNYDKKSMVEVGNKLYFQAYDASSGSAEALWVSDGTPEGTYNVVSGSVLPRPHWLTACNGKVYGSTLDFQNNQMRYLFVSDGTSNGSYTRVFVDSASQAGETVGWPYDLIAFNNSLYFKSGGRLWRWGGTSTQPSGIKEESLNDWSIEPNPGNQEVNILGNKEVEQWEMYDIEGKLCETGSGKKIQMEQMEPGLYFLRILAGSKAIHLKFIKN